MAKNNFKTWGYGIGVGAAVIGLFMWPIVTDPKREEIKRLAEESKPLIKSWNEVGVHCLPGHSALAGGGLHIHQQLLITVDGVREDLKGDIGIVPGCMAEVHVHSDTPNLLHTESLNRIKKFPLAQFFIVYGKPIQRDGYKLEVSVNGTPYATDPANLILQDKQVIEMKYIPIKN